MKHMSWVAELKNKLAHLRGRGAFDDSLEEELRLHQEQRAEELTAQGLSHDEAMAAARREFGPAARLAEETREEWRMNWLEDLVRDLRYAARTLYGDRGFTMTAVVSLALGIGANTTIFSLASEFLLKEPAAQDPRTLVRIQIGDRGQVGMREYRFLRDAAVFAGLVGFDEDAQVNWRSGERSERLFGIRISDNFFEVTHVPVAFGRVIQSGERDAVLVSQRFWKNSLNGDPGAVGRTLILDGQVYTIAGVLPANHRTLVGLGFAPDLYLPIVSETAKVGLYGRLPEGVTPRAIGEKLRSVCAQLDRVFPADPKWASSVKVTRLTGIARYAEGNKAVTVVAEFFLLLLVIVGLLLIIACANVASLLLARAAGRTREFAIRMSIGAGRGRLVRQLLAESLLLSALGAAAGLGLNLILTNALNGVPLPVPVPIVLEMQVDWVLLAYLALIAVASAVMAGLLPALTSTRSRGNNVLKRDEHQVGSGVTLRKALVTGQLAVSVVVLLTAALFVRNLLQSVHMDPGFDTEHTSWAQMRLVPESYAKVDKTYALIHTALETLRAAPGVESATFTNVVPLNDRHNNTEAVSTNLRPDPMRIRIESYIVAKDFFKTLAIPILVGREFQDTDREGSPAVIIINNTLARMVFGEVSPVGQTIRLGSNSLIVIGVAADSKTFSLGADAAPVHYQPYLQRRANREILHFLIRANVPPSTLSRSLNKVLLAIEPNAAVEVKPMSEAMGFAMLPSRAGAGLLGSIGLLGLTLASIGLYGVLTYSVSRRIREIGLRVALGAQRGDVLRLVLGEGAWVLGIGLAIGILVSVFVTKPLALFLVSGLTPSDPLTYLSVTAVLIAVGCVASLRPAFRALRADPAITLRYE